MTKKNVTLYDTNGKFFREFTLVTIEDFPDVIAVEDRIFVAGFSKYSYTERSVYRLENPPQAIAKQEVTLPLEQIVAPLEEKLPPKEKTGLDKLFD